MPAALRVMVALLAIELLLRLVAENRSKCWGATEAWSWLAGGVPLVEKCTERMGATKMFDPVLRMFALPVVLNMESGMPALDNRCTTPLDTFRPIELAPPLGPTHAMPPAEVPATPVAPMDCPGPPSGESMSPEDG